MAKTEYRSIQNQTSKCALDNPDLPIEFIKELLISKNMDKTLAESFEFKTNDE